MRRKTDKRKYEEKELKEWWKQVAWMRKLYWSDYVDEQCKAWALREYEKRQQRQEVK